MYGYCLRQFTWFYAYDRERYFYIERPSDVTYDVDA